MVAKGLDERNQHLQKKKKRRTYWIQEKNLIKWTYVILLPLLIAITVAIFVREFSVILPSLSMYQCGDWNQVFGKKKIEAYHESLNIAINFYTNIEFALCMICVSCIFWLRNI